MPENPTEANACEAVSEVTEHHKRLEPFVGTFRAEVKLWMGPGEPMVSTGTMVNTFDLGGLFLAQTYTGDPSDGPFGEFAGRGFWGYNIGTNKYEGFWIDTASPVMQNDTGTVDGNVWTMIGQITDPQTRRPMNKKSIITLQDNDHHLMEMFFEGPDGGEVKGMEIRYTRQA